MWPRVQLIQISMHQPVQLIQISTARRVIPLPINILVREQFILINTKHGDNRL